MKNVINIVIDLETASRHRNAAILSIGAKVFWPNEFNSESVTIFGNGEQVNFVINAASCITAGLHFEMETVKWWSERSDEAKASILATPMLLTSALESLSAFFDAMRGKYKSDIRIWCQGTDFDIPILANAYRVCGLPIPWKHTDVRDARTFVLDTLEFIFGSEEKPYNRIPAMPDGEEWIAHSALSDARRTAWNVSFSKHLLRTHLEYSPEYRELKGLQQLDDSKTIDE